MANGTQQAGGSAPLIRTILIDLAVMSAIGLALALIGPMGSYATPFAQRLIYWMGLSYAGYCCYRPLSALILRLAPKFELPEWPLWIFAVLFATVPMAIIVWVIGTLTYGELIIPSLEQALQHYFNVLVIGAGITVVFYLVNRDSIAGPVQSESGEVGASLQVQDAVPSSSSTGASVDVAEVHPPTPRFFERLPPTLGTGLIALEMEDHYVRAHTDLGSDLILLRMRDAVAELDGLDGAQIHRSWWVARGAVADVKRDGRNIRLVLDGGLEAPVSRANVAQLKGAGWF